VVFSWLEYPDKKTYEAANKKMMDDPRMKEMFADMPFDGKRMIFGGFDSIVDESGRGAAGYADGYVVPVPSGNKQAYREMAAKAAAVFKEYGATRVVEAWGDDVPDGKVTDFKRAVKAKEGENVVFSFVEWPDKATRDAAWPKIMEDKRMQPIAARCLSTGSACSGAASGRSSTSRAGPQPERAAPRLASLRQFPIIVAIRVYWLSGADGQSRTTSRASRADRPCGVLTMRWRYCNASISSGPSAIISISRSKTSPSLIR
jgi:uncharacterized protein YbaA (DUF1428 family)